MFTTNKFYIGDFYIPQAKPSISDDALGANNEFNTIVERSEEACLIDCLGYSLYRELISNIDKAESTLIKAGADEKWNKLVNGDTYTRLGETKSSYWLGIRHKSPLSSPIYNASLLTGYVYFMYHQNQFTTTTASGEKRIESANSSNAVPSAKVTKAWNYFVDHTQGRLIERRLIENNSLYGIDYFKGDYNVSLYDYIEYKNKDEIVFADFEPKTWERLNSFGI